MAAPKLEARDGARAGVPGQVVLETLWLGQSQLLLEKGRAEECVRESKKRPGREGARACVAQPTLSPPAPFEGGLALELQGRRHLGPPVRRVGRLPEGGGQADRLARLGRDAGVGNGGRKRGGRGRRGRGRRVPRRQGHARRRGEGRVPRPLRRGGAWDGGHRHAVGGQAAGVRVDDQFHGGGRAGRGRRVHSAHDVQSARLAGGHGRPGRGGQGAALPADGDGDGGGRPGQGGAGGAGHREGVACGMGREGERERG